MNHSMSELKSDINNNIDNINKPYINDLKERVDFPLLVKAFTYLLITFGRDHRFAACKLINLSNIPSDGDKCECRSCETGFGYCLSRLGGFKLDPQDYGNLNMLRSKLLATIMDHDIFDGGFNLKQLVIFIDKIILKTIKLGVCLPKLHCKICSMCPLLNGNVNLEDGIQSEYLCQKLPLLTEYITMELRNLVELAQLDIAGVDTDVRAIRRIVIEEKDAPLIPIPIRLSTKTVCLYRVLNKASLKYRSCDSSYIGPKELFTQEMMEQQMIDLLLQDVKKSNNSESKPTLP